MPHTPFKSSPHTTNGKPDPSMKPFPGEVGAYADLPVGNVCVVTLLQSRCTLKGVPAFQMIDGSGNAYNTCTAATLDANTLTLTFQDNADEFSGLTIAPRDPAVRGPQGQYMTTAPIGGPPVATPVPLSLSYDVDNHRWIVNFNIPVEAYANPDPDVFQPSGFDDEGLPDAAGNLLTPNTNPSTQVSPTQLSIESDFDENEQDAPPVSVTLKNLGNWVQAADAGPTTSNDPVEVPYVILTPHSPPRFYQADVPGDLPGNAICVLDQPCEYTGGAEDITARKEAGQVGNTNPATNADGLGGSWTANLDAPEVSTLPDNTLSFGAAAFSSLASGMPTALFTLGI